jgi:hypothetical protein
MNPLNTLMTVSNSSYLWAMTRTVSDWREPSHHKATHGMGAHAKAHFEWAENNYTGMFQKADQCVIRMANAAAPGGLSMGSYGPNLAVKCLRDGAESANMQFIWQLDGYAVTPKDTQKSCSYFEAPLSNHCPVRDDIDMPLKWSFIKDFQALDSRSMWMGVSQMATGTQNGATVSKPMFPFALVLEPDSSLNSVSCNFDEPISQLLNIQVYSPRTLFNIYAVHDPSLTPTRSSLSHLGKLVIETPFTKSSYGDRQLFFRHRFWQEEFDVLKSSDPDRATIWESYASNADQYKKEGSQLYWPLLPGAAGNATRLTANMLQTDIVAPATLVV